MNKRIKKKHSVCGKVCLKQYRHNTDEALPMIWFDICNRIREALGHSIGKRRQKKLERYFRRKHFWSEKQRGAYRPRLNLKPLEDYTDPFGMYNDMVNQLRTTAEKYEDAMILDFLMEEFGG